MKRLWLAEQCGVQVKQWSLIWIGLGVAYFFIGINLSSDSPLDKQILVGLLAIALATLVGLDSLSNPWKVKRNC